MKKAHVKVETVLMQLPGKTNHAPDPTALAATPDRGASRTAIATACLRAAHQLLDAPPRVLEDPVAV
jgi:hypothetical protein